MSNGNYNARILIIDDEKRMCESLEALLGKLDYKVDTATDGNAGSEKIADGGYDLILSDIKLPGKDGISLLREAKEKDPNTVVILMTAYASLESAVQAVSEGAYDYLLKPVEFSHLKMAVNRALDKRFSDRAREELVGALQAKNEELQQRIAEINALYRASQSMSTTVELPELLSQIINLATAVIGATTGSIMLMESDRNVLRIQAAVGVDKEVIENTTLPLGSSIAGYVAMTGKPIMVKDIEHDERFRRDAKDHYHSKSFLCVPLKVKNEILGVINLTDKASGEDFGEGDLKLLTTFASQAAIAIDDANHYEDARKKLRQFTVLYEISSMLPEIEDFDKMSSFIHHSIRGIIPLDFSLWMTWHQRSKKMVITFWEGWGKDSSSDLIMSEIEMTNEELASANGRTDRVLEFITGKLSHGGKIASFASVPVYTQGMLNGLFCIGSLRRNAFTIDHEYIASIVASQATSVYERQRAILNATRLMTMGNMMSEISHDLRKPLTNIRGGLQVLKSRFGDDSKEGHIITEADEELRRLSDLVKELVDFSNPNKYNMEKRRIEDVLHQVMKLTRTDAERLGIDVNAELDESLPPVSINFNEMMEVFLNLTMNAFDAMRSGGELRYITDKHVDPEDKIEYARIRVRDSGAGIEPEDIDRIFERYFTSKDTGTGLGLAVVERIVMAHNGKIKVDSKSGEGTTFSIMLPM